MPEREFEARSAVKERLTARAEQIAATGKGREKGTVMVEGWQRTSLRNHVDLLTGFPYQERKLYR